MMDLPANPMLTSFSDLPIYASMACFVLTLSIFLFLILHQQIANLYKRWDSRFSAADEATLMELLATGNAALLPKLHRSYHTRDMIVRIASKMQGDGVTLLIGAYSFLGFAVADFKDLAEANLLRRMKALERCRTLKLPLPESAWGVLLSYRDQTFRWSAMEYLILLKAKDSLLWLLWFLNVPHNQVTGMALHLSCCFAKTSPLVLPILLDHSDDKFLHKIWLQTLALYPVVGSEDIILRIMGERPATEILGFGMRALAASSSETTKQFLLVQAIHKDWTVRKLVAELLQSFSDMEVIDCLGFLAEDMSFPVRMEALETLNMLGPLGQIELDRIAQMDNHPAKLLVEKIIGTDGSRRSA